MNYSQLYERKTKTVRPYFARHLPHVVCLLLEIEIDVTLQQKDLQSWCNVNAIKLA